MIARRNEREDAETLMLTFAERTGLSSGRPPRRYLWSDAFAVGNFLDLARGPGRGPHAALALRLVAEVHRVLGRHRADDERQGWLSGLGEAEGAAHPTWGGLRIGKALPERAAGEPFDERLEWERDGQYFHYLTQWMRALDRVAQTTREPRFNLWARELAVVAHRAFTRAATGRGGARMVWKMSIDLSRPLIASMGQHDPLDGLVTCAQLGATGAALGLDVPELDMAPLVDDFASMLPGRALATSDPLGLGGLLTDASRIAGLVRARALPSGPLLRDTLAAALEGLPVYVRRGELREPASRRLAFRELGLAIGLRDLAAAAPGELGAPLAELAPYAALGETIPRFWQAPANRHTAAWAEHRDINDVMLAAALLRGTGIADE